MMVEAFLKRTNFQPLLSIFQGEKPIAERGYCFLNLVGFGNLRGL